MSSPSWLLTMAPLRYAQKLHSARNPLVPVRFNPDVQADSNQTLGSLILGFRVEGVGQGLLGNTVGNCPGFYTIPEPKPQCQREQG